MIVYHLDRYGNPWRFSMNCTKTQAGIFCRFLKVLRQTNPKRPTNYHRRSAAYMNTAQFCANLEQTVLTALSKQYPVTPQDIEQADATGDYFGL